MCEYYHRIGENSRQQKILQKIIKTDFTKKNCSVWRSLKYSKTARGKPLVFIL